MNASTALEHPVELSNEGKCFFPDSGLSKGDIIGYYRKIATHMLPWLRNRPLVLQRFPDGLEGSGFYQRNMPDYFPDWIGRVTVDKGEQETAEAVVCNQPDMLVYLANQGCLTFHPWLCQADALNYAERLVIDLDPSDNRFDKVQEAAMLLKSQLDELSLASFVMTTGSRGLHVVVPLKAEYDFDTTRRFAGQLAERLAGLHDKLLTTRQRKEQRGDRVFLDVNRNAHAQTSVAPYSIRARKGAPVATPLRWDEAGRKGLDAQRYTVRNIFRRLGQQAQDPWHDFESRRQQLPPGCSPGK